MRGLKKLWLTSLLIAGFVLSASAICSAQITSTTIVEQSHASPVQKDSDTLKALEITNIKLEAALKENGLLRQQLDESHATTKAREDQLATKDEIIDFLKSAGKDRATVNNGDARVLEACNQQLAKTEARVYKLEHPGIFASIFDKRSFGGFMTGYGIRSAQSYFTK